MKILLFLLIIIIFPFKIYAKKTDVILGGFAINSDYNDLDKSAFYTNKLLNRYNSKQNIIDKSLSTALRNNNFENINIIEGLVTDETTKIVMSVFLDQELFEEFELPTKDCKKILLS